MNLLINAPTMKTVWNRVLSCRTLGIQPLITAFFLVLFLSFWLLYRLSQTTGIWCCFSSAQHFKQYILFFYFLYSDLVQRCPWTNVHTTLSYLGREGWTFHDADTVNDAANWLWRVQHRCFKPEWISEVYDIHWHSCPSTRGSCRPENSWLVRSLTFM
jgi:hypothetical protein